MAPIEIQGLTKRDGKTVANDGLEFSLGSGEIFGYLGPNGSGKSTTIRHHGFHAPTEGTVMVGGWWWINR